jgi:hypothetical protein
VPVERGDAHARLGGGLLQKALTRAEDIASGRDEG